MVNKAPLSLFSFFIDLKEWAGIHLIRFFLTQPNSSWRRRLNPNRLSSNLRQPFSNKTTEDHRASNIHSHRPGRVHHFPNYGRRLSFKTSPSYQHYRDSWSSPDHSPVSLRSTNTTNHQPNRRQSISQF